MSSSSVKSLQIRRKLRSSHADPLVYMRIAATACPIFLSSHCLLLFAQTLHLRTNFSTQERAREQEGFIDEANMVILSVDTDLCVTDWNRFASQATGMSRERIAGRPILDALLPPETQARYPSLLCVHARFIRDPDSRLCECLRLAPCAVPGWTHVRVSGSVLVCGPQADLHCVCMYVASIQFAVAATIKAIQQGMPLLCR